MRLLIYLSGGVVLDVECSFFEVYDEVLHVFSLRDRHLMKVVKEWIYMDIVEGRSSKSPDEILDDMERE